MVTPRLLPLSILMLNGQMPKLYLQLWRMWWLKLNPSMGWWCGRVHRMALQPSRLTPILSSSLCYLGRKSNGTSLRPCMWKQRDSGIPGPFGGSQTLQVTALGRSKAAHEFLVLHYFGVDSAMHWDVLTSEVLPAVQLPGASARRATALEMFGAST